MNLKEKLELQRDVIKIIADLWDLEEVEIGPLTTLESIGLDSLDKVELFMKIEDEYLVSAPDGVIEHTLTIQDLLDYIESKLPYKLTPPNDPSNN